MTRMSRNPPIPAKNNKVLCENWCKTFTETAKVALNNAPKIPAKVPQK